MADIKQAYGSSTGITITLADLAAGAWRESTAIDNQTNKFLDVMVQLAVKMGSGTPAGANRFRVYLYGSEDGTTYPDVITGADAAITPREIGDLILLESIDVNAAGALTYAMDPEAIAKAFGGVMPRKWGIIVLNDTGLAFDSTEGNHSKTYTGVYATVV